jgi:23S rRNA (guanine2535-N1)-methyltransferase
LFSADALQGTDMLKQLGDLKVDIVVTDIPYGKSSSWQFSGASRVSFSNPAWHLLQSLLPVLSPCSIVAIAAQKQQKIAHEEYKRVEYFQVGKRKVVFLVPLRMNQG